MRNTKIRILCFILAAAMLTGCGAEADSDSKTESSRLESSQVESSESRTEFETESTTSDSSETDSSALDSSEDDSSDSSGGESSEATTTTKTSEESKTETEKAVTTTKQTTTTSAVTTKPYVAPATTTTKPVVTTKATQKPIVTTKPAVQTTKTTTKATTKQTADPTANLSPFMKAMYRVWTGKETKNDIETIRQEYLNYGKSLKPKYKLDKSICLWIGKDGKPTNNCSNGVKDYVVGVASKGSDLIGKVYNCTHQEILNDIAYMDKAIRERIYDNLMYVDVPDETQVRWYFHIEKRTDLYGSYDCFTVLV